MYYQKDVGTSGTMQIRDYSDVDSESVEMWMKSSVPYGMSNLPWAYTVNGVRSSWMSKNFNSSTNWQLLGIAYHVGYSLEFTLHLGDTSSSQLDGPQDFTISLAKGAELKTVSIKVDGEYKRAVPFVKVAGIWKPATPMIMINSEWKPVS